MSNSLLGWAKLLGGHVVSGSIRCPGPGHSRHDNSLVVTLAPGTKDGFTVHSHAGDDWRVCKDHVRSVLGLAQAGTSPPSIPQVEQPGSNDRRREAARIWSSSFPFHGSPAQTYLQRRLKGHAIPDAIIYGGSLRWNPNERKAGSIGAMVALMTDPRSGKPTGVHRTYISSTYDNTPGADGSNLRLMKGTKGVVRLWPDEEVSTFLAIGEGIETVIAGAIELKRAPAWSMLDAGNMQDFPPLPGIEGLTIFVDHDHSGRGEKAAKECARQWYETAGIRAHLVTPTAPGDLNDVLTGEVA